MCTKSASLASNLLLHHWNEPIVNASELLIFAHLLAFFSQVLCRMWLQTLTIMAFQFPLSSAFLMKISAFFYLTVFVSYQLTLFFAFLCLFWLQFYPLEADVPNPSLDKISSCLFLITSISDPLLFALTSTSTLVTLCVHDILNIHFQNHISAASNATLGLLIQPPFLVQKFLNLFVSLALLLA